MVRKIILHERTSERILEQIMDVPVPPILEEIAGVMDVPVLRTQEGTVEVIQPISERIHVEVGAAFHRLYEWTVERGKDPNLSHV